MFYVDHLIIGCLEITSTKNFYMDFFKLREIMDFIDTGTGGAGIILGKSEYSPLFPQLLLVPFEEHRLPNPQHVAFRLDEKLLHEFYTKAKKMELKTRAKPSLLDNTDGFGSLEIEDERFINFYIVDPSNVNIELICKV